MNTILDYIIMTGIWLGTACAGYTLILGFLLLQTLKTVESIQKRIDDIFDVIEKNKDSFPKKEEDR